MLSLRRSHEINFRLLPLYDQAEKKVKARERVYTQCTSPLLQLGEDQGAGNPNGKPFTEPHDSFAKRSLKRSCLRKQRGFKDNQATKLK
ncbi:hypothetical protein P8452_04570 [Trifolium repens]|nr:hypothetical protein P8452_04570 [Trifolium repens]